MTFQAYENSAAKGEPILLFDFSIGIAHWRYTTADRPIRYGAVTFEPVSISRSAPKQSQDIRQQIMTVTVPRSVDLANMFAQYPPAGDMLLTVTMLHYEDPDQQGIVDWIGRVISPTWKGSTVEFQCEPVYTSVQTTGLRRRWGLNCPHVLYGTACTVNSTLFRVTAAIQAVSGFNISSAGFVAPAGLSFVGGFIEWDSGMGYTERRTVDGVSGTTLTVAYGSSQLVPGLSVNVYPGCNRTLGDCQKFGNNLNFGGQPNIPTKNPMDGSLANPVY